MEETTSTTFEENHFVNLKPENVDSYISSLTTINFLKFVKGNSGRMSNQKFKTLVGDATVETTRYFVNIETQQDLDYYKFLHSFFNQKVFDKGCFIK
eukprot:UN15958